MAKLLADECVPRPVCVELRRLGHDVREVSRNKGVAQASGPGDLRILQMAIAAGRIVLSDDEDFDRIHQANPQHSGIVRCEKMNRRFQERAAQIDAILRSEEDWTGRFRMVPRLP